MKALIIGGAGFVGGYLIEHLFKCGWEVSATKMPNENINLDKDICKVYNLDILDKKSILDLLNTLQPDCIFHLAAQSSVQLSWKNPQLTVDVNIKGSLNLLDSIRDSEKKSRVILIGSGEEYGYIKPNETPVKEENKVRPGNIYAVTKACQNMIGTLYTKAYGMDIVMVRAFNHIGARQLPMFVVADFCKQVAEIEKGKIESNIMKVGNLSAKRDFTDVSDVVCAYELLARKGRSGETYNVGSGKAIEISEILNMIILQSTTNIKVELDQERLRPVDIPIIEADISKLQSDTGWKPLIPIEQTIKESLQYWRENI